MRRGFTLIEAMLASALLGFSVLALFEGVCVATRIAHENAELLVAEGVAWDAAWKRFNENYNDLQLNETTGWQTRPTSAAPDLFAYDEPAKIKIDVTPMATAGWLADMKVIEVDVSWGPSGARRSLVAGGNGIRICRGSLGRAP